MKFNLLYEKIVVKESNILNTAINKLASSAWDTITKKTRSKTSDQSQSRPKYDIPSLAQIDKKLRSKIFKLMRTMSYYKDDEDVRTGVLWLKHKFTSGNNKEFNQLLNTLRKNDFKVEIDKNNSNTIIGKGFKIIREDPYMILIVY